MPLSTGNDDPVSDREFAALMAPLGPFGPRRRVLAAVSGGADSTALALLLRRWGDPTAIVVDHGLRPEARDEAEATVERLRAIGVPATGVRLELPHGPSLGARARAARYGALLAACRAQGRPDLVLGHHAQDQVETVTMRARAGSRAAGMAGMAAVTWRDDARLLRPLLPVHPARLRATVRAGGMAWVEDPTNNDPATARGAMRHGLVKPVALPGAGDGRRETELAVAAELAAAAMLFPAGFARVTAGLSVLSWSMLVWTVSGREHPPSLDGAARLARSGFGTLHGVCVRQGWVFREPWRLPPAVDAVRGARWDARFVLGGNVPGGTLGALGGDAARLRRRPGPPVAVLAGLPAVRVGGKLLAVPHMDYAESETCLSVPVWFRPPHGLAGAMFMPAIGLEG